MFPPLYCNYFNHLARPSPLAKESRLCSVALLCCGPSRALWPGHTPRWWGPAPSFAASPALRLSVLSLNLVPCQPPTHRSLYKSVTKCRALGTVQGFPARSTVSEESVNRPEDSETSVAWTHVLGSWTNSQSASARLRALV